jgi:hypothetical protein
MAKIIYTIDKEGNYSVETQGVEGHSCTDITKKLVQTIGGVVDEERYNDDYYKAPKATITNNVNY